MSKDIITPPAAWAVLLVLFALVVVGAVVDLGIGVFKLLRWVF